MNTRSRLLVSALLAPTLLAAGGCSLPPAAGGDPAGAELRVDRDPIAPGARFTLSLTNRTPDQVGYNLCVAALDRRVGDDWQPSPHALAEVCTMELRLLEPGAAATFQHTMPAAAPAGEYRIRTAVEAPLGEAQVGVATSAFRVGG
jgi:hypothetical protein